MYQKMISYIYEYIQEEKGANIGFVKLALQNHQYKMKIHLKNMCLEGQDLMVYGFVREDAGLHTIPFGTVKVISGIGEGLFLGATEELSPKYRFLDMSGLVFIPKENVEENQRHLDRFCATQWDNHPLIWRGLDILEKKEESDALHEQEESNTLQEQKETDTPQEERNVLQEESDTFERTDEQDIPQNEDELVYAAEFVAENPDEQEYVENESKQESPEESSEETIWDLFEQRRVEMRKRFEQIKDSQKQESHRWKEGEKILSEYTPMCPFFDKQVQESVRIEPKDIGAFPMEYWYLANNSFLLHGYYCYRHLLFMKLEAEQGSIYAIGVPGNSHYRERFMANMFGFEEFKPVHKKENAGFGYWWKRIY